MYDNAPCEYKLSLSRTHHETHRTSTCPLNLAALVYFPTVYVLVTKSRTNYTSLNTVINTAPTAVEALSVPAWVPVNMPASNPRTLRVAMG